MRVTIKDIARELGLSESAVSLALNQRPGVSDATRQRVISCARSLGYDRGHLRAHQEQSRTVLVAHYQKRIHTPVDFFSTLLSNAERELRKSGISLVSTVIDAGQNVIEQLEHHVDKGCTGVIVLATEMDEGDWHPFSQLHLPVVLLDTYLATAEASCVTIHNREGARQATQLLLSKGRGCPGFLGASLPLLNFKEREEGFLSAIQDAGYGTALAQRLILSPYVEGAEIDLSSLLDAGLTPLSGYFAANDHIAIGAMRALQAHGYRIPEDVSIVGFDNTQLASYVTPSLTSVRVPLDYYAHIAAKLLLEALENDVSPLRIEVGTTLVRRASTL